MSETAKPAGKIHEAKSLAAKTLLNSVVALCVAGFLSAVGFVFTSVFKVEIPIVARLDQLDRIESDGAATRLIAEDNRNGILDNSKAIRDLRVAQDIVEYDETRSGILAPCPVGTVCVARFYLRRTEFGLNCGLPRAVPYVENHARNPIRTQFRNFKPVQIGRDWETLETPFLVPLSAKPGDGGFYVRIEYPGCDTEDQDSRIYESTITLPFEILPKE